MLKINRQQLQPLQQLLQPLLRRQLRQPLRRLLRLLQSQAAQRCLFLITTYSEDTNSVRIALSFNRHLRLTTQASQQTYGATSTPASMQRKTSLLLQLPEGTITTTRLT